MPDGWVETTLGGVTSFAGGYAFPPARQGKRVGEFPFMKVSDMNAPGSERLISDAANRVDTDDLRALKARTWPAGTVIFPKVGAALLTEKRRILGVPAAFDNNVMGLIPGPEVLPDYLFAVMCEVRLGDLAQHGAVPSVNQGHIVDIPLLLPPLADQRRIVNLIGALDAQIEALELEARRAERLAGSIRDHSLTPRDHGRQVRLAEVTKKIGSGATPRGGGAIYIDSGVSLIRSQNVHDGTFVYRGLAHIDRAAARALDSVTVESDDVLINITGASVNRVCKVPADVLPARVNQHVAILRSDPAKLDADFLAQMLLRRDIKHHLDTLAGAGTTRQALTKAQLGAIEFDLPPIQEQRRLGDLVLAASRVPQALVEESSRLRQYRQGLLAALLSGVEIPDSYDDLLEAL